MKALLAVWVFLCLAASAWAGKAVVDWKDGVNVRTAPGQGGRLKGKIRAGVEAQTFEEKGGWVRVRYPGGEGWVSKRSLRPVPEALSRAARSAEARHPAAKPSPPDEAAPAPAVNGPARPAIPAQAPTAPSPAPAAAPAPLPAAAGAGAPSARGGYLSGYDREEPTPKLDSGPGFVTVVSALLLVLALVGGAVYLLRLFSGRRYLGGMKGRGIQILATRPLGPRQALLLVEVGGLPFLLSAGEGGISLLSEIRDPEALRRLNDLYGFRETPFEAEMRRKLDLESQEAAEEPGPSEGPSRAEGEEMPARPEPSPEERLAALRRRRTGEDA